MKTRQLLGLIGSIGLAVTIAAHHARTIRSSQRAEPGAPPDGGGT